MTNCFTDIWRQCLQIQTQQALWSLYRAGLHCHTAYLCDIRDLGDAQILWEAILEAHRQVSIVQACSIPSLDSMESLRHRAIRAAMEPR